MSWCLLAKGSSAASPIFFFDGLMLGVYICRVCFEMKHFRSYILYRGDWTSKLWKTKNRVPNFQPNAFHDLFTASLSRLVEQERLNPLRSPPHFCIFLLAIRVQYCLFLLLFDSVYTVVAVGSSEESGNCTWNPRFTHWGNKSVSYCIRSYRNVSHAVLLNGILQCIAPYHNVV